MTKLTAYLLGLFIGMAIGFTAHAAFAADLAPPRKHYIERCLVTGEEPAPGQTLRVDKRCKSGLRWVYQR